MENLIIVVETTIENRFDYIETDSWSFATIREAVAFLNNCEETPFRYYTLKGVSDETRCFCLIEDNVFEKAHFILSERGDQGYLGLERIILGEEILQEIHLEKNERILSFNECVEDKDWILNFRTIFIQDRESIL